MAGGVSVPHLAAAVSEAGGLGFLAAGYKTADGMYQEIKQLRGLTSRPFGVNLFMPQPEYADPAAVEVYAHQLAGEAAWYETELGDPDSGRDDGYDAKLAILLDDPVPVVSFHFGCPTRDVLDSLARAGTLTAGHRDHRRGGAAPCSGPAPTRSCVQGVEAGGHQGTHRDNPETDGTGIGLLSLIAQVRETVQIPIIAAGGIMRGSQIAAVLAAGASAAQLGTAFLACPESGAQRRAQAGPDQPAVRTHGADPGLLRAPGARTGQPLHARARPVRARRVPPGPPPHLAAAQGGGQGGRRAGHGAVGRARGTGMARELPAGAAGGGAARRTRRGAGQRCRAVRTRGAVR